MGTGSEGSVFGENSFYRKMWGTRRGGKMGPGDVCRVPHVAVRHGRARQTSETGPCGDCRRVLWVPGARCQYSGEIRFMEKHGVQDEGCRHVAKHSSEPPGSLPRS